MYLSTLFRFRYAAIAVIALFAVGSLGLVLGKARAENSSEKAPVQDPAAATLPVKQSAADRKAKRDDEPKLYQENGITWGESYRNDTSPPLKDMLQLPMRPHLAEDESEANKNPKTGVPHIDVPDEALQDPYVSLRGLLAPDMPSFQLSFDGIGFPGVSCNCAPPDTNGEVGATQYVQMVNEGYQVFNKTTGASILGPSSINSLWAGFGGVCETSGNGDPVVLYDQLAGRWLISQFAGSGVPTDECIAISTTSSATGSYNRYGFHLGTNFFDYPHISVWPDGYYMSDNVFNSSGTAYLGPQPFVFNRAAMLAGTAATFITPGIIGSAYPLPADIDGTIVPPPGTACPFIEWPAGGTYKTYLFHADFATPANSTYSLRPSPPPAAGFSQLCGGSRACVPELAGPGLLDGLGDRLMHRLAYRRYADGHEAVVGNYTVSAGGVAGIRWFELRNVTSGVESVFQESTYQPDTTWRWMGSIAQDQAGNMALGYSASSSAINPQVRYAGRLANDPINTLNQGESHLFDGTGSQTGTSNRWGDYSAMSVDPADDCTFWYTQEYYATTSSFNWRTRIGSFKFPTCNGVPTPVLTAGTATLVSESCLPANGVIDPGETVTVAFPVLNVGTGNTANDVGTLQATGGVTSPGAAQNYGVMVAGGSAVSRNFTFTANANLQCGSNITATIAHVDGANNLGSLIYTLPTGTAVTTATFSENFDGVTAPALPAGWTTAFTGAEVAWVTSATTPNSAPNDAFAPDVSTVGTTELVSPTIAIAAGGGQMTFRNLFNMESTYDGMVLEISINGGAFADLVTAGGSFVSGGYNGAVSSGNGFGARSAWTGLSGGTSAAPAYITTTANLPAAANGQNVRLKWRAGTDGSVIASGAAGVRIDNVVVSNISIVCSNCSGSTPTATATYTATATNTATNTPTPSATATFTPTSTATNTPTATNTATNTPTPTATSTFTPTPTNTPTLTPTMMSTLTPTDTPTSTPTPFCTPAVAVAFAGTGVGSIPNGGSGTPPNYGLPRVISFAVSGISGPVTSVSTGITLKHSFVGNLDMVLRSPGGIVSFVTVSRIGVTTAGGSGDSSNYNGTYNFTDSATGTNIWTVAAGLGNGGNIAPGNYRTTAAGGAGQSNPAPFTDLTAAFAGLTSAEINGTWTLTIRDAQSHDTGTVTAANLVLIGASCP